MLKRESTIIGETMMELEKHTAALYALGYRQMPIDMQEMVLTGINKNTSNKNPSPFTTITPKEPRDNEYVTLSGGVFQEVFETKTEETFGNFIYNTTTQKISKLQTEDRLPFLIDPVAFAYDFGARIYDARLGRWLSTDPLMSKYAGMSPYTGMGNNPVIFKDPEGREIVIGTLVYTPGMAVPTDADIFTRNAIEGLNFLHNNTDEITKGKIELLANVGGITFKVEKADITQYIPFGYKVKFNDQEAAEYTNGNVRPSIVGFGHELDHAYMNAKLYFDYISADIDLHNKFKNKEITEEQYNMLYTEQIIPLLETYRSYDQEKKAGEEERATKGIETSASNALGVEPRSDYGTGIKRFFKPLNIFSTKEKTIPEISGQGQEVQLKSQLGAVDTWK